MPAALELTLREQLYRSLRKTKNGCWLWTLSVTSSGYGQMYVGRVAAPAHRMSWIVHNGPIPKGIFVCHKCDNPRCINPDHLFLGSHSDNMGDMTRKGRSTRGSKNPRAKFTEAQIQEIRSSKKSRKELAEKYGVWPETIWGIRTRRYWKHVI